MSEFDGWPPADMTDGEFFQFAFEATRKLYLVAAERGLDDILPILRKASKACEVLVNIRNDGKS